MNSHKDNSYAKKLLDDISQLDFYEGHVALPDLHHKKQMEAPSSTAIATGNFLVPTLASAAINDGMSIIKLPFKKSDISPDMVSSLFSDINVHAAKTKFDLNKYSLNTNELKNVCLFGARAVLQKFGLSEAILEHIESQGCLNSDLTMSDVDRLVPRALLKSKFSRAEFGLNFRGNHFLELQYVNEIANRFTDQVSENDLTIMSHLGPGPFTGNLMRLYTNRVKIPNLHKILYFGAKCYYHFVEAKRPEMSIPQIWKYFFNPDTYQKYSMDSLIGKDLFKLVQIGTNYGYAYQLATFAAVNDAVKGLQKKYMLPPGNAELIWNVSHNSIYKEKISGKESIVTRHNSVKTYEGKPTILAGSYDMPSCIGMCKMQGSNNLMNTHDHGIGSIIEQLKIDNKFDATQDLSKRYFYKRGSSQVLKIKSAHVASNKQISAIANYYERENVFRPWFYVSPIATLKN